MNSIKKLLSGLLDKYAIQDWRKAWDKYSVKFNAFVVAAGSAWMMLPDDAKTVILAAVGVPTARIVVSIAVISLVLRLWGQSKPDDGEKKDPS